jgi:hypothetical protein
MAFTKIPLAPPVVPQPGTVPLAPLPVRSPTELLEVGRPHRKRHRGLRPVKPLLPVKRAMAANPVRAKASDDDAGTPNKTRDVGRTLTPER